MEPPLLCRRRVQSKGGDVALFVHRGTKLLGGDEIQRDSNGSCIASAVYSLSAEKMISHREEIFSHPKGTWCTRHTNGKPNIYSCEGATISGLYCIKLLLMGSVDDQIDFIMGDFFLLTHKLKV
ncbi:hypothetical protein GmHk_15G044619 [Glycine max]|nr:hypothetical protein GmHk_15G044619 [Glycine max]